MRRKIFSLLLISAFLVGCSSKENTFIVETIETKDEKVLDVVDEDVVLEVEKETEKEEKVPDYEIGNDTAFKSEVLYKIDLNNDGEKEEIIYYVELVDDYIENPIEDYKELYTDDYLIMEEDVAHLVINGIDYDYMINIYEPLRTKFFIVDYDKSDDYYEIIISTYGPSDDLASLWFRYDGETLINIGLTEMIPGEGMYLDGKCGLTIHNRTDILETSFISVEYEIVDNEIRKKDEDGMIYEWKSFREGLLTTNIDLVAHVDRNLSSETIIIPKGMEVECNATDNIEWVNVFYDDFEYWIHVQDFKLTDNDIFTWEAFDNLFLAD